MSKQQSDTGIINRRMLIWAIIIAAIISSACGIGYSADISGELMVKNPVWWSGMLSLWIVLSGGLYFLFYVINFRRVTAFRTLKLHGKRKFVCSFLVIFACWIPVFLAEYPGFFVYDATDEYVEVATRTFTTHHPLLHVLMLGGSVCAGNKFLGDFNIGIAFYTLFQMLFVSLVFAWVLQDIRSKRGYICALAWYGLFPTVVMFALCSAKDTFFAAMLVIAVVISERILGQLLQDGNSRTILKSDIILLCVSLCLMMLFRHNGVYGFLFYAFFVLLILVIYKRSVRQLAVAVGLIILILASYKTIDKGLQLAVGATDSENQEILTVPIQQLARTWWAYREELDTEDAQTLYELIGPEIMSHYTPNLSDPVKAHFNNGAYSQNPARYRKLWWKLFKEHPLSYVNAWIDTCYGYFYPFTVVNVYEGHEVYTFTYTESSYFGYEVEQPGVRYSKIPAIDRLYRWLSLDKDIQCIPVISFFFSMGGMFVIYVVGIGILMSCKHSGRRNIALLTALSLPVGVWLTLLLGPTFLPRYTVFLWFLLPWFISRIGDNLYETNSDTVTGN